jgi:predicted NAD/FAD-binding protein
VSGLVAARELHRAGHGITVFEAGALPGGHSNTVEVQTPNGAWSVDTGFIVFNDRNYPNFRALLGELGVDTQPSTMSFSVSDGRGGFEWAATPIGLFANLGHIIDPSFHRMLLDLRRFFREARELIGTNGHGPSLREFCETRGYSEYFVERLIVPQVSAVWSADPEQLWTFPASFIAEFFANHGSLQLLGRPRWHTVTGGSRRYVDAITAPYADRIRTSTPVGAVRRDGDGVTVAWDGGSERFDHVVFACHSDQALGMLADPTDAEREVLGAIAYQENETVLHTDDSLMPRRRAAWASWNYHLTDEPAGQTTVTYHMNRLQSLGDDHEFLVTLNRTADIDPSRVIQRFTYSHPVYTREAVAAQRRWDEISRDRTHYCGAYWRWGFHEDGVWSALRACEALGALERGREFADRAELELAA